MSLLAGPGIGRRPTGWGPVVAGLALTAFAGWGRADEGLPPAESTSGVDIKSAGTAPSEPGRPSGRLAAADGWSVSPGDADRMAQEVAAIRARLGLNVLAGTVFDEAPPAAGPAEDAFMTTLRALARDEKVARPAESAGAVVPRPLPPLALPPEIWPVVAIDGATPFGTTSSGRPSSAPVAVPDPPSDLYRVEADLAGTAGRLEQAGRYEQADAVRALADQARELARTLRGASAGIPSASASAADVPRAEAIED